MAVVASYFMNFSDGEYLNYLVKGGFLVNEELEKFFDDVEALSSDPYDGFDYELQLVKTKKKE